MRRTISSTMICLSALACADDPPATDDFDATFRDAGAEADMRVRSIVDASIDSDAGASPEAGPIQDAFELPDLGSFDVGGEGCVPQAEACNGIDDDCDGRIDEDAPEVGEACDTGGVGPCAAGSTACVEGRIACVGALTPEPELCDGGDNDCDGRVDEALPEVGMPCLTDGAGLCEGGRNACVDGAPRCVAVNEPAPEVCDGLDNDCDALTDEEDGDGRPCVGCVDDRPDVALMQDCRGGQTFTHVGACAEEVELHVVGVYEPNPRGAPIRVSVDRVGAPLVLVLSTYEPAEWQLAVDPAARVEQVILNGYDPSRVVGVPDGAEVVDRTGVGNYFTACAYRWPADDGGCDTPRLVAAVEQLTGLTLTSFQGCYGGVSFNLANAPRD